MPAVSVLIIEGVTGTGKTSVIAALQALSRFELIDEVATFDDFMTEFFADPTAAAHRAHDRMAAILDKIEEHAHSKHYLLERFHFSQLALGSELKWYQDLNERCEALAAKVAVLVLPKNEIARRSLYRLEHGGKDWQNLIDRYGSEAKALRAIKDSQGARIRAVEKSCLQHRKLDTTEKAWRRYAMDIADWAGWPTILGMQTERNVP
jgi:thymidylate kinase